MKFIKILIVLILIVLVILGGAFFYLTRYLRTPEFKERVLAVARDTLKTDVAVEVLDISIFKGITLRGVRIANPTGFDGDFLNAQTFLLRYRLWPLLSKRVEVERVEIGKAKVMLAQAENGIWNYEPLFQTDGDTGTTPAGESSASGSIVVALEKLVVSDSSFALVGPGNKNLIRIEGLQVDGALDYAGDKFRAGDGIAKITTMNVADWLYLRNLTAPLKFAAKGVELNPVRGSAAGGTAEGDAMLQLLGGFLYKANITVKGASVDQLLAEAETKRLINGGLEAKVSLEGTGGISTMKGDGKVRVTKGRLTDVPLQRLVATLLQIPELQEIIFEECVMEFTMAHGKMPTPVFRLDAPKVQILANGVLGLDEMTLDHELTLAIDKEIISHLPRQTQVIFKEREDGWLALTFRVSGPFKSPKTDIPERLAKGAAEKLLEKGLDKIFKR